jgi:hypothetical protein
MWDVFKCIKSLPEVPHAIILVCVIIDALTVVLAGLYDNAQLAEGQYLGGK